MHPISTLFNTSYISYTRRGKNIIYLQFFPSYADFQTGGGKMLWIWFTWTVGGKLKVTPICPSMTMGAFGAERKVMVEFPIS